MKTTIQATAVALLFTSGAFACTSKLFSFANTTFDLGSRPVGTTIPGFAIPGSTTSYDGSNGDGAVGFGFTAGTPSTLKIGTTVKSSPNPPLYGQSSPVTFMVDLLPSAVGAQSATITLSTNCGSFSGDNYIFTFKFTGTGAPILSTSVAANPMTPGAGEPVSTATGELFGHDEQDDLSLGGPMPLSLRRYYGSFLSGGVTSALGTNWMHNYEVRAAITAGTATVTLFRGKTVKFTQSGGAWQLSSTEARPYQFAAAGSGYQFMSPVSNLIYTFNSSGALTAIQDRNGNTLTITQSANGPVQIADGLGRTLTFTYTGANLTSVQDQAGRTVSYEYTAGNLSAWTNANGKRAAFSYTTSGGIPALMTTETRPAGNNPLTQVFDSLGRVASQTDSFANSLVFTYLASGGGATLAEPGLVSLTLGNDGKSSLNAMSDPSGGSSAFTYDSNNRPLSITDRLGQKTTLTWDPVSGLPATYTDEGGARTSYTWTASNAAGFTFYDLTGIAFNNGSTIAIARDAKGNITGVTDQAGNTTKITRTAAGLVATITNPSGGVTTLTYGANNLLASAQAPSGDITRYAYDNAGRLTQVTNPDNTTRSFAWDAVGNPTRATDERSGSVSRAYDANNNLKTVADALNNTTTVASDADDRVASVTDALGNATVNTWDALSRLQTVANAAGNSSTVIFDSLSRINSLSDASRTVANFTRDAEGRLLSVTDALSRTVKVSRDSRGFATSLTTANNETYQRSIDSLGRLSSITDPLNRVTQYSLDANGRLSGEVLPGGVSATFTRNESGLVTATAGSDGNAWTSTFDSTGRITSATDPAGQKSSFQYDSRQRLSSVTYPAGNAQFQYDAAGNLTGTKYSDGTNLTYSNDSDNRLTSASGVTLSYNADGAITGSNGLQIGRDPAGRIASVTYGAGKTVNYTYNNRGFLIQVSDWVGGSTAITYDAAGQLASVIFANGVRQDYTWDLNGRLATLKASKGATSISSITLRRDALGRITGADRTAANVPDVPTGYLPLNYDASEQLLGATYDSLGRLTKDTLRSYTWDLASRLTAFTGADGAASATYDAMGQRISRTASGATQNYILNYALPLPSIATVQSGGADVKYYVWLPNGELLESINATGSIRRFYHFDESGSTSFLTDDNGAVTDSYAIAPYGETVTQTGTTDNPFTWQGAFGVMREGATSLYYMRARYYDSATARFLARDPIVATDARAIDPYQFVYGNPLEHSDPAGTGPGDPNPLRDFPANLLPPGATSSVYPGIPLGVNINISVDVNAVAQVHNTPDPIFTPPIIPQASIFLPPVDTGIWLATPNSSSSGSLQIPRFNPGPDRPVSVNVVNAVLLYPFVTNTQGFDTGVVIANTSVDPFGTAPQPGTCTLSFYGSGAPASSDVNCNPPAGTLYTPLISSVAPGFQGYMIAVCNFRYAHAFPLVTEDRVRLTTERDPPTGRVGDFGIPGPGYPGFIIPGPGQSLNIEGGN